MTTGDRGRRFVGMLLMALATSGCGGGGGDAGSSSGASTPVTGNAVANGATARVDRPYLFIGTCYVCGSSATPLQATLDGQPLPGGKLDPDAIVIARGTQSTTTTADGRRFVSAGFSEFEARSAVVGRVEWIDLQRGRIGVLGQEVHGFGPWVGAVVTTPRPGAEPSLAIVRLEVGQRVRVFGFDSDGGPIVATGVHDALAGSPERVTGRVTRLDLAARQLTIGALSIDWSAAGLDGFPGGAVQVGDRIEAVGATDRDLRLLRATNLVYREAPLAIAPGAVVDAYGLVTAPSRTRSEGVPPATTLRLGGEILRIGASCTRALPSADGFAALSAAADTDGVLQPEGGGRSPCRLRADYPNAPAFVTGPLERRDTASGSLRVLDVTVQAQAGTTWFEAANVAGDAATFRDGDPVTIGLWAGIGPARGVAAHVQRADTPVEAPAIARFEGWMSSPGPGLVTFLGRGIRIDAQTRAGLRSCAVPFVQPLTAVAPESFVTLAYTIASRWITASVVTTAAGEWRAVTIETWNDIYCD